MAEESNIQKTQPKEGLQTGSLEGAKGGLQTGSLEGAKGGLQTGSLEGAEGGLSAKQQVAREYEPALSGSKGPDARFDAIQELINIRVREANNSLTFSSPSGTQIFGLNGKYSITETGRRRKRPYVAPALPAISPWDLVGVGDNESFAIPKPGRIYTSYGDSSSLLTIEDADLEFSLGAGDLVWLELTFAGAEATPTITLKAGNPPTDWPKTYLVATPPATPKVTKAYFELYEGKSGTIPPTEFGAQRDGYWIRKSFRYGDSILIWGTHEFTEDYVYVPVPMLVPR